MFLQIFFARTKTRLHDQIWFCKQHLIRAEHNSSAAVCNEIGAILPIIRNTSRIFNQNMRARGWGGARIWNSNCLCSPEFYAWRISGGRGWRLIRSRGGWWDRTLAELVLSPHVISPPKSGTLTILKDKDDSAIVGPRKLCVRKLNLSCQIPPWFLLRLLIYFDNAHLHIK